MQGMIAMARAKQHQDQRLELKGKAERPYGRAF
jgi:hypothetical protein